MMDIGSVRRYLGGDWNRLEDVLSGSLRSGVTLLDATNKNLLENGGKMLRPLLSLLMARACGTLTRESLNYAAATELLHNATLLHDDVVDDSAERRGRPTVYSMLGKGPSVLIGDFWLVRAIDRILASEKHCLEVTGLFARTLSDLAEGEIRQMEKAADGTTTEADYLRIINVKTASLFRTACVSAAISVDAPEEVVEAAGRYGESLGLAFQIQDDILDYEGGEIGKPVGVDLREQKITLPLLGALAALDSAEAERVRGMVARIGDHPEYVAEVDGIVRSHGGLEYARRRMAGFVRAAVEALGALRASREREILEELARYCASRAI